MFDKLVTLILFSMSLFMGLSGFINAEKEQKSPARNGSNKKNYENHLGENTHNL